MASITLLGDRLELLEEYWPEMVIRRMVINEIVVWYIAEGMDDSGVFDDAVSGATLLEAVNTALDDLGANIPDQVQ